MYKEGFTWDSFFCPKLSSTLYLVFIKDCLVHVLFKPYENLKNLKKVSNNITRKFSDYLSGKTHELNCKTKILHSTPFEKKVYNVIKNIPYGQTRSYKWVAEGLDKPKAARAVGNALNKNPLPIIYPCHRVISTTGKLGGFAHGTHIKKQLLLIEKPPCNKGGSVFLSPDI